ncbi:hypothetical protein KAI92_01280 [Candidatus Parcubacteria bacterium]|nr:hypothetical protein [Candidatus Parcubacteria bacterium]
MQLPLPDNLLLSRISNQNVYCDKKSLERSTGITKPKYKLAGNILKPLEVYAFFIATKNKNACNGHTTIKIQQKHWENKCSGHLASSMGYIDLHKVETMSGDEICQKMRDRQNGFPFSAKLCDTKYEELKKLKSKVHISRGNISTEKIALAGLAIKEVVDFSSVSDNILKNLGLD